jgi:hypothetical protein
MIFYRQITASAIAALALSAFSFSAFAGYGEHEIYTGFGGLYYQADSRSVYNAGCSEWYEGWTTENDCSSTLTEADAPNFNAGNGAWDIYTQQDTVLGPTSMSGYVRTTAASYAEICCSGYSLFDVQFATSSPSAVNGVIPDPRSNTVLDFTLSGTMHTANPGTQKLELTKVFGYGDPLNFVINNYDVNNFDQLMPFKLHGTFGAMTYYRLLIQSDAYSTDGLPWDTLTFKLTTAEVEFNGERVSAIYNLDIDGTIYNIYFDQRAGDNLFVGDEAAALAAIDAVNDVLNADYDTVDNGHPLLTPMFSVMTDTGTMSAYQSCNISAVSTCNTGDWATQTTVVDGLASDQSAAYFEKVVLPVEFDPRVASPTNSVDPATTSNIIAGMLSTSVIAGDANDFNAADIDKLTLAIGPFGAANNPPASLKDLDGDGDKDLRVRYIPADTGIACEDTEISITAETLGGWPIAGTSSIVTPECEDEGCHP